MDNNEVTANKNISLKCGASDDYKTYHTEIELLTLKYAIELPKNRSTFGDTSNGHREETEMVW